MNQKNESSKKYYDPELVSIVVTAVGAIGSISAIISGALAVIEYKRSNEERRAAEEEQTRRRESLHGEMQRELHSLLSSLNAIEYELNRLEYIYKSAKKVSGDAMMKFGSGVMWLEGYQFNSFYRVQTRILSEAQSIYSSLRLIEELLSAEESADLARDMGYNVRMRSMLEELTYPVNDLMSNFGHMSVGVFLEKTIQICGYTRYIVAQMDDNFMDTHMHE